MLLLDSEALSSIAHGPAVRRNRVRALIHEMRRRELPIATVAAVLAEVVRGRPADAAVFGELRRERVLVHPVDTAAGVRAGRLLLHHHARQQTAIECSPRLRIAREPDRRCVKRFRSRPQQSALERLMPLVVAYTDGPLRSRQAAAASSSASSSGNDTIAMPTPASENP